MSSSKLYLLTLSIIVLTACQAKKPVDVSILAGAASATILPTIGGNHDYIEQLPDVADKTDPFSPGYYVDAFDQGVIDIDNGSPDAAWVHDDIRSTALALQSGDNKTVLVASDVYMITATDGAEIIRRAKSLLPEDWKSADILISSTHNHHGPSTMFSVNDAWYELMATQTAKAIADAVAAMRPAEIKIAKGEHRFGLNDARDPIIIDTNTHIIYVTDKADQSTIATAVQWNSHVEETLGWAPPIDVSQICIKRHWPEKDCSAAGRYITADYPGELRASLIQSLGGEVLYFVGAIGSQIGPGQAPVWEVDAEHPVGNGWTIPEGAKPIRGAKTYLDRNFSKAEVVGEQLAARVIQLREKAREITSASFDWKQQSFFTRMHQLGFRALLAQGKLAWQVQPLFNCTGEVNVDNCIDDGGDLIDDPVAGSIRKGNVVQTSVGYLQLDDDAGLLYMPGEFPPEYLVGLPKGFRENPQQWYRSPKGQHATSDYELPGYVADLVDDSFVMGIGLGNDELGYWVPMADIRVPCAADAIAGEGTCQKLFEQGFIAWPKELMGSQCKNIVDNNGVIDSNIPQEIAKVLEASCYYGMMIGQTQGYTEGHYEETNSAGWDLMEDSWKAYKILFGQDKSKKDYQQENPNFPGLMPETIN